MALSGLIGSYSFRYGYGYGYGYDTAVGGSGGLRLAVFLWLAWQA